MRLTVASAIVTSSLLISMQKWVKRAWHFAIPMQEFRTNHLAALQVRRNARFQDGSGIKMYCFFFDTGVQRAGLRM